MKYLLAVLMMGLLSACSLGASSPSEQPLESIGQSESMAPSTDGSAAEMASPSESAGASDAMSSCEDAWQSVDLTGIETSGDLDTVASELDQTFQDCDTLSDWLDQANAMIPMIDTADLQTWAETRCSEDTTLSDSPVCAEISS